MCVYLCVYLKFCMFVCYMELADKIVDWLNSLCKAVVSTSDAGAPRAHSGQFGREDPRQAGTHKHELESLLCSCCLCP